MLVPMCVLGPMSWHMALARIMAMHVRLLGACVHGCTSACVQRCMDTCVHRCLGAWVHLYMGTWDA